MLLWSKFLSCALSPGTLLTASHMHLFNSVHMSGNIAWKDDYYCVLDLVAGKKHSALLRPMVREPLCLGNSLQHVGKFLLLWPTCSKLAHRSHPFAIFFLIYFLLICIFICTYSSFYFFPAVSVSVAQVRPCHAPLIPSKAKRHLLCMSFTSWPASSRFG